MRKLIAAINMSLDGFFDHTAMSADDEIHRHYKDLINSADAILYGRITYQLMEYWLPFVKNPSGNKSSDEFAVAIDRIPKIVFSHTLKNDPKGLGWASARLATKSLEEEALALKQQTGKDVLVGSRSLIVALLNLGLIDEFQLCVHPTIVASGSRLLENVSERIDLKLLKTKLFSSSGAMLSYYEPVKRADR